MRFKSGRGGAREGAGRKPKWSEPVIRKGLYATAPQWAAWRRAAELNGESQSGLFQSMCESMKDKK